MTRLRPRTLTRRRVVDHSEAETSMPVDPFAVFLLHRHSSRAEEEDLPRAASGYASRRVTGGGNRSGR